MEGGEGVRLEIVLWQQKLSMCFCNLIDLRVRESLDEIALELAEIIRWMGGCSAVHVAC